MTSDLARRGSLLTVALGAALLRTRDGSIAPETAMVRRWLDTWHGLGDIVTGMNRQGYRLHLSNVDASTGRVSLDRAPLLSSDGVGTGSTPWPAVQVAAWAAALTKALGGEQEPPPRDEIVP